MSTTFGLCMYITKAENQVAAIHLSQELARQYSVRCLMLTSGENPSNGVFTPVSDIQSTFSNLIANRLTTLITDAVLDIRTPHVTVVSFWVESKKLYMNGKSYNIGTELQSFVVDLAKEKAPLPCNIKSYNHNYIYAASSDIHNFAINFLNDSLLYSSVPLAIKIVGKTMGEKGWVKEYMRYVDKMILTNPGNEVNAVVAIDDLPDQNNNIIYFDTLNKTTSNQVMAKFVGTIDNHLRMIKWSLHSSLGQLRRATPVSKQHDLCAVVEDDSNAYLIELVKALDAAGVQVDVYGINVDFKHYKGVVDKTNQGNTLKTYKHCIAVETQVATNFVSEAVIDGIVSGCVCFYRGAPNVQDYLKSPLVLVGDVAQDCNMIQTAVKENEWVKRIDLIATDKIKILTQYCFEPRVNSIVKLSKTFGYAVHQDVLDRMKAQGFNDVTQSSIPMNLTEGCVKSLQNNTPFIMQMSANKYENMFDWLCFAYAKEPNADAYYFKDPNDGQLDICIMPSGCELILRNVQQQKNAFDKLKFCSVY